MATMNVRRPDDEVVRWLKQRAAVSNGSLESETRQYSNAPWQTI